MPKNIIICCDGTGNEIEERQSNVLKLYRMLKRDHDQAIFYNPGIGTMGASNDWGLWVQKIKNIFGMMTGAGLDDDLLQAYDFLVRNYEDGDLLYFFGFSRGAYTVRALAGFVHVIGVMRPDQLHMAGAALTAYKKLDKNERSLPTRLFEQALKTEHPSIAFLGMWDTVSSVLVPRPDRMFIPSLYNLAFTDENSRVVKARHALAIDERRRMFRPYHWKAVQDHYPNRYNDSGKKGQDTGHAWFVGVHSDVGGGVPEESAGLSKITLEWMIEEAGPGLRIIPQTRNQIAKGHKRAGSGFDDYCKPDPLAPIHPSLKGIWRILEVIPKWAKLKEWPKKWSFLGLYLPLAEPRFIAKEDQLHSAVADRHEAMPEYDPVNLRDHWK